MNYIYKIVGNFNDKNFEKIINKVSQKFKFMYVEETLFLAPKSWKEFEGCEELVNNTFRPVKDFYIETLNNTQVEKQQHAIKDWCLNNCVRLDRERYEVENQERLKEAWKSLYKVEEELKRIAEENEVKNKEENRKEVIEDNDETD